MEQRPGTVPDSDRHGRFLRALQIGCILALVLGQVLAWVVGTGGVGAVNLSPRTVTVGTNNLCMLAAIGAVGLGWAMFRTLPACFRMVTRGHWGGTGPLPILGSLSTILLCWSLWDLHGGPCAVVLVAGFALTDGVMVASGIWNLTGGRLLRWATGDGGVA